VIGEDETNDLVVIGEGNSERVRLTVSLHRLRVILREPKMRVRLRVSAVEIDIIEGKIEIKGK